MPNLQEILQKAKDLHGVTDPKLGIRIDAPDEIEKLWIKAKTEVTKKTPLEWFDFVLNENLKASESIKTVSDLKYYGFLKELGNITELERIKKTCGLFSMTIKINKDTPKSGVLLYNPKTSRMYRYPDWDSYIGLVNNSKKKAKNRV